MPVLTTEGLPLPRTERELLDSMTGPRPDPPRPVPDPGFDPLGHSTCPEDLEALRTLSMKVPFNHHGNGYECVEVGSWAGITAEVLMEFFDRVYCVDTWLGTPNDVTGDLARTMDSICGPDHVFRTFCRNMVDDLFTAIIPCRGQSLSWASIWPRQVGMVFIDADHSYEAVKADIEAWRPHVVFGGILCGHDYGVEGFEGVKRAVDELIPAADLHIAGKFVWWTKVR